LLAGALARGDLGIDFDGAGWRFLESPGFLLAVFGLAVLSYGAERSTLNRAGGTTSAADEAEPPAATPAGARRVLGWVEAALGAVLGGLLFAGTLDTAGREAWPGMIAGIACAALAWASAGGLFDRARRRLDDRAAGLVTLYAEATALLLVLVAVLVPAASFVALVAFAVLLVRGRRHEPRKYAGLRLLR
jgi:hypothetical protein